MNDRAARLSAAIHSQLPALVRSRVRDPRVGRAGLMTITKVEVSSDGRYAKVGVSFVGGDGDPDVAITALTGVSGMLRGEIGRALGVRHAPELRFVHDRSGEFAAHIDALLKDDPKPVTDDADAATATDDSDDEDEDDTDDGEDSEAGDGDAKS